MAITFDPVKRVIVLRDRQLDFARARDVFEGEVVTIEDRRFEYGEFRFITAGYLDQRMVVMVWTQRGDDQHIISMRHCHGREEDRWLSRKSQQV